MIWAAKLLLAVSSQAPACAVVEADRILAGDLAAVAPTFRQLPAELVIGFAPIPGVTRVFTPPQLNAILQSNGVPAAAKEDVCFTRRMGDLDPGEVRVAMLTTLQGLPGVRDIEVNIVEMSLAAVPVGKSVFPLETLGSSQSPGAPALWKGYVEYAGGKRWNIWARANVRTVHDRVLAATTLERGHRIQAGDIKIEAVEGIPNASISVQDESQVVDRELKWTVAAGQPIPPRALQIPVEITAGQIVKVSVRSAAARLSMEARAESAGKRGDYVLVRNLETKKAFRARVAGIGRAEVDVESR